MTNTTPSSKVYDLQHKPMFFLAGIAAPGLGHALKGRWAMAFLFPLLQTISISTILLSRIIIIPWGLYILISLIIVIQLISGLSAHRILAYKQHPILKTISIITILVITPLLTSAIFLERALLFGLELYYIPSRSMTPTLKIGDIILVDEWKYEKNAPENGDVVVFNFSSMPDRIFVKRIAEVRGEGDYYYLLGDNPDASQDSRYFGPVKRTDIRGKVIRPIINLK